MTIVVLANVMDVEYIRP